MIKIFLKNSERGQAIILIALAIIGMIGMVGLMTDGGILLIEYARLKRGIDSASVAAALQYRQGYENADLEAAAEEFLKLNQSDVSNVVIETCSTAPGDSELCTTPQRKLVRVTATRIVRFGFMRVLGFISTPITVSSIGEAASIDVILVIDTSASMAYDGKDIDDGGTDGRTDPGPEEDPFVCNADNSCSPMLEVKNAALGLMPKMFFPYDRVGIVTLTSQNDEGFRDSETVLELSDNYTGGVRDNEIETAINNIKVLQSSECDTKYGPCRNICSTEKWNDGNGRDLNGDGDYNDAGENPPDPDHPCYGKPLDYYLGQECPYYRTWGDPTTCGSSNIGGALYRASTLFGDREDSFWVVILLVGGPPNATDPPSKVFYNYPDTSVQYPQHAFGYCPDDTWASSVNPLCRESDITEATRHPFTDVENYDADDYARDQADFLANPETGQGVTIYTIGLGDQILNAPKGTADAGEQLLEYIAYEAGETSTAQASHGQYFFAPDTAGLEAVFSAIAENIFTRISR